MREASTFVSLFFTARACVGLSGALIGSPVVRPVSAFELKSRAVAFDELSGVDMFVSFDFTLLSNLNFTGANTTAHLGTWSMGMCGYW